jgi:hypothetical protein
MARTELELRGCGVGVGHQHVGCTGDKAETQAGLCWSRSTALGDCGASSGGKMLRGERPRAELDKEMTMKEESLDAKDVYKIALDTRNFEIGLFWQRSNYFLALNTALAVGFFNVKDEGYALLLALFGLAVSALWYRVNLGSKFWQVRWEQRLRLVEEQLAPDLRFFAADWETVRADVRCSLAHSEHGWLQKYLDKRVLKKHSVSYQMIRLSLIFTAAWALLSVTKGIQVTAILRTWLR